MLEEISHLISHFNDIFNTLSTKDLAFLEFQEANQQNTFFKEEVRNTQLAPFNTKCLFLKLKFLAELHQQPPNQTVYRHYCYNVCFPCNFKLLVTTFNEEI